MPTVVHELLSDLYFKYFTYRSVFYLPIFISGILFSVIIQVQNWKKKSVLTLIHNYTFDWKPNICLFASALYSHSNGCFEFLVFRCCYKLLARQNRTFLSKRERFLIKWDFCKKELLIRPTFFFHDTTQSPIRYNIF